MAGADLPHSSVLSLQSPLQRPGVACRTLTSPLLTQRMFRSLLAVRDTSFGSQKCIREWNAFVLGRFQALPLGQGHGCGRVTSQENVRSGPDQEGATGWAGGHRQPRLEGVA